MKKRRNETGLAVAMLLPSFVVLVTFILYPLGKAVVLGQQRCNSQGTQCQSNGWDQYVDVFRSEEFQHALWVTVKFALLTVPLGLALGIGLAVLADRYIHGIGFFRTVFSSTVATSVAVASIMWLFLFQPSIGVLANIGWIGDLFPVVKNPGLLRDPGTALGAVAVSSVWANLGFTFVLVTAGLQGIPRELNESAFVDGAGAWTRFTNVTLPMLAPTLLFTTVVLTSRAFQAYGEVDLLTQGGPRPEDSTTTLTYLIYGQESLIRNNDGLQAASAVLLFLVMLVLSVVQFRGLGRKVHYG
ncbi:MAG TPA: sugar ABC transporter permease [Ilumatobacteraceae bacterium]